MPASSARPAATAARKSARSAAACAVLLLPPVPALHESVAQHGPGELRRKIHAPCDVNGDLAQRTVTVAGQCCLLEISVGEALLAGPETRAHQHAIRAQHQRSGEAAAVCDTAGGDKQRTWAVAAQQTGDFRNKGRRGT